MRVIRRIRIRAWDEFEPEEGGMVRTYRDVRGYYNPDEGVTDWWYDD